MPTVPEGSPAWHFMQAFGPTGYIKFVKIFEFVRDLVVMVPRLRNLGLLLLGPVIVNIVAYHALVYDRWILPTHVGRHHRLHTYLLWDARHKFSALLN